MHEPPGLDHRNFKRCHEHDLIFVFKLSITLLSELCFELISMPIDFFKVYYLAAVWGALRSQQESK